METSASSSASEDMGQRRAMMAKLKKLRQENLHLKLRLHAQEKHTASTANKSQVEDLRDQFMEMKADKEDAERKLAVVGIEREPCNRKELDDTLKLPNEPIPALTESSKKDERPKKMVAAMTSGLVKMGTYHQHLEREKEALKDQEAALEDKKNVLAVELKERKKELETVQQEANMQQRTLRKKKIKRSKPVRCLK